VGCEKADYVVDQYLILGFVVLAYFLSAALFLPGAKLTLHVGSSHGFMF